ncbi:MAG: hypothetical protein Q9M19_01295 [Mariprofundaceae bacterium]|nr:hypothetical protein [Mariprofundaceae bacterium]
MKQLELELNPLQTSAKEQRHYLKQVRIDALSHFLGSNHPKTLKAKHDKP